MQLRLLIIVTAALCTALLPGCGERAERYVMVSGGQAGVYYPTAGATARLAQKADPNLRLDVQTSGGSVANARLLHNGDAHFALIQNDIAAYARAGDKMFVDDGTMPEIRGVAALYPEHIQIVARAAADIESISDLAGKRVAIGAIGSGTEANALQILEAHGLSEDDLGQVQRLKAGESRDYLQDGRIDAAFFTFGVGTAAIQELAMVSDITFVPVAGDGRAALIDAYPFYREAVIPAGAYQQAEAGDAAVPSADVPTVSVMATLVARDDVPAAAVENVLRGIFDHLDQFKQTHPRLRAVNRADAQGNLTIPAHAGATAFYETE